VLMLLGERDDNLPVAKIESYLAYARGAGNPAPIETVTYPGAYHAWTVPWLPCALSGVREHKEMPAHSARAKPTRVPHQR